MGQFKVGDKVEFVENYSRFKIGDVVKVTDIWSNGNGVEFEGKGTTGNCFNTRIKLAEPKKSKNERITELEKQVERIPVLEKEVESLKSVLAEILEIKKPTEIMRAIPSAVEEELKTPNQQRAEIIEKAKKFVEESKCRIIGIATNGSRKGEHVVYDDVYKVPWKPVPGYMGHIASCNVEFVINSEKLTIVALMRGVDTNKIYTRGIAKCHPQEVFNEHIGKAISLGRALGLDVSEFEQAVQPNEVVEGMKIKWDTSNAFYDVTSIEGEKYKFYSYAFKYEIGPFDYPIIEENCTIINDTNAQYEV